MRKFIVVLIAGLFAAAAWNLQAQVQRLPIQISGTVQTGAKTKVKITNADLVSTVSNRLVLAVNLASNTAVIEEWNANGPVTNRAPNTADTAALFGSYQMAVLKDPSGKSAVLACNLEDVNNGFDLDGDGKADTACELLLTAQVGLATNGVITKVSGNLMGVMNDPQGDHKDVVVTTNGYRNVSGTLLWQSNAQFSGKIKSSGPVIVP